MFGYGTFAQVTFAQGPFVQEVVAEQVIGGHFYIEHPSRKKKKLLEEAERAEQDALRLAGERKNAELKRAAESARQAIAKVKFALSNARTQQLLGQLTDALDAAGKAKRAAQIALKARLAQEYARQIDEEIVARAVQRQQEDDDDMAILLLLS